MACAVVQLPTGGAAIVCGPKPRHRCCACGAAAPLLCDWKVAARTSGTCDRPVCARCAASPAPGKDLCPAHAIAWTAWRAARADVGVNPTMSERK
jgi:hypothetical protein